MKPVNVALIGCGTVGGGVAEILLHRTENIQWRLGALLNLSAAVDLRIGELKDQLGLPETVTCTTDYQTVTDDPDIDIVVELMGGIHPALEVVTGALSSGKDVVTANKALLAKHGDEIFHCARENGQCIAFEASVGGGIPIVQALREGFAANRIESIYGIVNGTCNYILTQMLQRDMAYEEALSKAQAAGYAETPPTLDVEGHDTAHKLAVMARVAFGVSVALEEIPCEGITSLVLEDVHYARKLGYTPKLLAVGRRTLEGLELRVSPCLLRHDHQLASINGAFNAVCVNGDAVGQAMLTGLGAGRMPTASAVVADLIGVATGTAGTMFQYLSQFGDVARIQPLPLESVRTRYYIHLICADRPGVLAQVAGILGRHEISIASCIQQDANEESGFVPLVLLTHEAIEGNLRRAIAEMNALECIKADGSRILRVEDL